MSTIAASFSSVSTKFKVGAASAALVAAATLTPATIAVAAPPSVSIAQVAGASIEGLSSLPVVATGLNATANASVGGGGIVAGALVGFASIPLVLVTWVRDTLYTFGLISWGNAVQAALESGPFPPAYTA